MSPLPSSPAVPAPQRANLQPVPSRPKSYRWPVVITILVLAGAAWQFRPHLRSKPAPANTVHMVKAVRGVLQKTLRVSGSVAARNFSNIFAPIVQAPDNGTSMVLISLAANGSFVKEGDVVAEIDGQAVKDHLDDVQAMVDQTDLDLRRVQAQQQARREAMEQSVRAAKAMWDKAKLDMKALSVKSAIQAEQLKLALEEAQANYEEVHGELDLLNERQAAEWRIAELGQESQVRHRNRHRADLGRFTVRAPRGGQVVLRSLFRNGEQTQVRLGDQVSPGMVFMKVVDLKSLHVEGAINQTEAEMVRLGQKAVVRFDAYPTVQLDGKVEAVGTMAGYNRRPNYYVRSVPVRIAFDSPDPRVIPDLTANADVVVGEDEDALLIPREAVQESGGKAIVMVKEGETVVPREVALGAYSNTQVSVIAGLHPGDQVAIP
jgi:multidrug efflux pump subunit AcrA (membrane-fusion protein)